MKNMLETHSAKNHIQQKHCHQYSEKTKEKDHNIIFRKVIPLLFPENYLMRYSGSEKDAALKNIRSDILRQTL